MATWHVCGLSTISTLIQSVKLVVFCKKTVLENFKTANSSRAGVPALGGTGLSNNWSRWYDGFPPGRTSGRLVTLNTKH